jgi:hypothetical protein
MNKLAGDETLKTLRTQLMTEQTLMQNGIFEDPETKLKYFTGYEYKTLYDWDQYFESILQIYMGWSSEYIRNGVTIFLDHQQESGLISRSVPSNPFHDPEHVKPFLAQIAVLVVRNYGETKWILNDHYFPRLQRYLDYWLSEMDSDKNGLSEWMSAPHTGMDNQHERAGYWNDHFCEGVDLNSYLVRELRAIAYLALLYGKTALTSQYNDKADALVKHIRDTLWDIGDGFFYDRNMRSRQGPKSQKAGWASALNKDNAERIRVKSVASFTTLWAGVATIQQARRMICEHLFNPREFWTPYPVAALARNERWYSQDHMPGDLGCNWRAKTWIPTNYMIYRGLRTYGYRNLASIVAHYTLNLVRQTGNREYYDSETGEGCGLDPFWGWSLLAHFLPYEELNDFDVTALPESIS